MSEGPQRGEHRIRQPDVARLPFIAGVELAISGVITLVFGLYSLNSWWGWLFIALGILIAVPALMLVFRVAWARVAAVAVALVSIAFTAVWVPVHFWFAIPIVAFDVLAIYAVARSKA